MKSGAQKYNDNWKTVIYKLLHRKPWLQPGIYQGSWCSILVFCVIVCRSLFFRCHCISEHLTSSRYLSGLVVLDLSLLRSSNTSPDKYLDEVRCSEILWKLKNSDLQNITQKTKIEHHEPFFIVFPSTWLHPGIYQGSCCSILVFCIIFCRSLFFSFHCISEHLTPW
jgi:hypothetical protein